MVKSETHRDADTLVRNPSPRLFGNKCRDSKKVKTNHAKTRLRDLSKTLPRFRDPVKIFRDPRLSRYHSPPLNKAFAIILIMFNQNRIITTIVTDKRLSFLLSQAASVLKNVFASHQLYDKAMVCSFYPNVIFQVRNLFM